MMPLGAHRYLRCYACNQPSPGVPCPGHWRPIVRVRGDGITDVGIACSQSCYDVAHILLRYAGECMDYEDAERRPR